MNVEATSTAQAAPARQSGAVRAAPTVMLVVVAAAFIFLFARLTIDDAYISWRYGQMLVEHGVWGFNPSGPPVEAYTNPLYAGVSIVPAVTGIPTEFFFKLVSAGLLAAVVLTVLRAPVPSYQRGLLLAVTVANPTFHVHLWSGLETPLFVLLLMLTYGQVYRTGGLGPGGYALALALALTRPEGIGYAVIVAVWALALQPSRGRCLGLGGLVLALIGYWVARTAYFGLWWPNTFYVKTANTGVDSAARIDIILRALLVGGTAVAAVLVLGALHRRRGSDTAAAHAALPSGRQAWAALTPVVLALASAGVLVVVYDSGNLLMDYANRFEWQVVFPVLLVCLLRPFDDETRRPVALAVTIIAAVTLAPDVLGEPWRLALAVLVVGCAGWLWVRASAAAALAAVTAVTVAVSYVPLSEYLQLLAYRARLSYAHGALGNALARHGAADSVLTVGDAGLIPFRSGWTAIDVHGLADHDIAVGDFTAADLRADPPEVIIVLAQDRRVSSERRRLPVMALTADFARDPANGYVYSPGLLFRPGYRLHVWMREDVAPDLRPDLRRAIRVSDRVNDRSEADFLGQHLFEFPFLGQTDARG